MMNDSIQLEERSAAKPRPKNRALSYQCTEEDRGRKSEESRIYTPPSRSEAFPRA